MFTNRSTNGAARSSRSSLRCSAIGRQPPPALLVQPEDALQARAHRHHARRHCSGHARPSRRDRRRPRRSRRACARISSARHERLARDLDQLAREQLRLNMLIDERQKKQAADRAGARSRARARRRARAPGRQSQGPDRQARTGLDQRHPRRARRGSRDRGRRHPARPRRAQRSRPAGAGRRLRRHRGHLQLPVNGVKIREFGAPTASAEPRRGSRSPPAPGAQITAPCDGWVVYAGPFAAMANS